jgi:hypothetical protein
MNCEDCRYYEISHGVVTNYWCYLRNALPYRHGCDEGKEILSGSVNLVANKEEK